MSRNTKLFIGVASLTAISVAVFIKIKKQNVRKNQERLERVSEEGYEFAHDILYPMKKRPFRRLL